MNKQFVVYLTILVCINGMKQNISIHFLRYFVKFEFRRLNISIFKQRHYVQQRRYPTERTIKISNKCLKSYQKQLFFSVQLLIYLQLNKIYVIQTSSRRRIFRHLQFFCVEPCWPLEATSGWGSSCKVLSKCYLESTNVCFPS